MEEGLNTAAVQRADDVLQECKAPAKDVAAQKDAAGRTLETEDTVSETLRQEILRIFPHKAVDLRMYSPLSLAFLGDGVYSVVVRTIVVSKGNRQAHKLHEETRRLVSARAQARIGDAIRSLLTEEEERVYHRGLNANPGHHAKNATLEDYLKATALETLCGYLYLQDNMERFLELLKEGMERARL